MRAKAAPHRSAARPRDNITFGIPLAKPPPCPNQYIVPNYCEAPGRVLWSNPTPLLDRSLDVLGPEGHIERANAWTHLVACILFLGYAVARGWLVEQDSVTSQLSAVSIYVSALTFATSVIYHTFGTVPGLSGYMRDADILSIYLSMGVSSAADVALVTNDLDGVSAQSLADPLLAVATLGVFFTVRRSLLTSEETLTVQFEDYCRLGLYRFLHSDLEHAGLRTGGMIAIVLQWVLLLPAALDNLSSEVAALYFAAHLFGAVTLVAGVIFDNALLPDKALAGTEEYWERAGIACGCASKRLGCAMSAHAWWHVVALFAAIILTASREFGISRMTH